jgi:hypothetical protein
MIETTYRTSSARRDRLRHWGVSRSSAAAGHRLADAELVLELVELSESELEIILQRLSAPLHCAAQIRPA